MGGARHCITAAGGAWEALWVSWGARRNTLWGMDLATFADIGQMMGDTSTMSRVVFRPVRLGVGVALVLRLRASCVTFFSHRFLPPPRPRGDGRRSLRGGRGHHELHHAATA